MPDLSWPGWGIAVSILLAIMPALKRLRDIVAHLMNVITEIFGVIVLVSGVLLFVVAVPQRLQLQTQIAQLSADSNPGLDELIQALSTLYFGAIILMMVGGLITVFGILDLMTSGAKKK